VCNQDDANAVEFALNLGRLDCAAAHDARSAGSSVGFGHAIDGRQASLQQPGAYLPPQFVIGGR
jgi:hypothetical protein